MAIPCAPGGKTGEKATRPSDYFATVEAAVKFTEHMGKKLEKVGKDLTDGMEESITTENGTMISFSGSSFDTRQPDTEGGRKGAKWNFHIKTAANHTTNFSLSWQTVFPGEADNVGVALHEFTRFDDIIFKSDGMNYPLSRYNAAEQSQGFRMISEVLGLVENSQA